MMSSPEYIKRFVFRLAFLMPFALCPSLISAEEAVEYQVKAAFIYKFIKFTKWPSQSMGGPKDNIVVAVLGESPIWAPLKNLEGKKIMGRSMKIIRALDACHEKPCDILFVSNSEKNALGDILQKVRGTDVLTIGETEGFAEMGGMINFFINDGKIRFEINIVALEETNLRLSSKLLRLGKIVKTKEK